LEAVYDIEGLDMRADAAVHKQLEEDRKQDEELHSTVELKPEILDRELQIDDLVAKRARLTEFISTLPTTSNFREDLVWCLKKWILLDFAFRYGFKKLLLGTSAHKLSTLLLGQLAKGRGASVPSEIGYLDDKYFNGRIVLMNPMRDFLQKEIGLYNYLNKVPIVN